MNPNTRQNKLRLAQLGKRIRLAALCCAAPLAACEAPPEVPSFEAMDTNADGQVSLLEAEHHDRVLRGFEQADSNHDALLDRSEYEALLRL